MLINIKKRISLVLVVFCYVSVAVYAQDLHYSNLHENYYQLNPSFITHVEKLSMHLSYRNQWPGSSDFVTYSGAFFSTFKSLKSTVGVQLFRDDQGRGIINSTDFSLIYGYRTRITNYLSFATGISGSYYMYTVDLSKLEFENNQASGIYNNGGSDFFDFSAGLEFDIIEQTWIGISISHITSPEISPGQTLNRKYCLGYRGSYNLSNKKNYQQKIIEPLIVTTLQRNFSELIYGLRIKYSKILGGIYLRQSYSFNFDALIILLGINFKNTSFIYTYDINLSGVESRFNKLASHEVTFLFNFEYKLRRNKKGAIKCPKF
jgi:type IX secretion system PorP/SprF family membrane protein